jgi:hypothetical protein
MSCDTLQDALVEVARGREVGPGTVGAVEAHVEHCASCRARFARELSLSDGLRALARANASAGASAGIEAALLAAFTDQQAASTVRRSFDSWWFRAAAMLLMAMAGVVWWVSAASRLREDRKAPPVAGMLSAPTAVPTLPEPSQPATTTAQLATVAPPLRRPPARSGRNPAARIIRPDGFVALPSAAGLPAFESGEIVRVEVPVTSLPMYGIDIAPDARGPAVEADFLVGQDGQARAIRLVRNGRL